MNCQIFLVFRRYHGPSDWEDVVAIDFNLQRAQEHVDQHTDVIRKFQWHYDGTLTQIDFDPLDLDHPLLLELSDRQEFYLALDQHDKPITLTESPQYRTNRTARIQSINIDIPHRFYQTCTSEADTESMFH